MNRRDFLATGFKLGAAGLLLPFIEPARKVWALDRTMVLSDSPVIGDWTDNRLEGDYFAVTTIGRDEWVLHETIVIDGIEMPIIPFLNHRYAVGNNAVYDVSDYAARSFSSSI